MYLQNFPWIEKFNNLKLLQLAIINYRIFGIISLKYVMNVGSIVKYI